MTIHTQDPSTEVRILASRLDQVEKERNRLMGQLSELRAAIATKPHPTARWYSVSKDGMATLCADEADAQATARESDACYPFNAPHRAVQLVEYTGAKHASVPA